MADAVPTDPTPSFLIRPFAGLRPKPEYAAQVAAPPYDVLSTEEARAKAAGNPLSFLRVSKAEIDLPPRTDHFAPEVYEKAAQNFAQLRADGVLVQDPKPCYYAYRLSMGGHVQTGLAVAASVRAYEANRIRKHELTRPDKEDDRVRQIKALNAQTGPVLMAHRPDAVVAEILATVTAQPPAYHVVDSSAVGHSLWVIDDADQIVGLSGAVNAMSCMYIADGHHRSAAASRVANERRDLRSDHRAGAPYDAFLGVIFASDQMQILDYNRVVRDLNGLSLHEFMSRVGERFVIGPGKGPVSPDIPARFGMYIDGEWHILTPKEALPPKIAPVERLDVSLLSDRLLAPVLGITDLRRDERIEFIGGIRGLTALERRVDSGEMAVAFALHPTEMRHLMAVADAEDVMPPKSTWFEPKLSDGLISYLLEP